MEKSTFKNPVKRIVALFMFLAFTGSAIGQSQEKIYSLLIMNFAKGIQWPNIKPEQKFVIGVLEYPPLVAELKSSASGKNIEIKEFTRPEEIQQCQILFIPAYKAKNVSGMLNKLTAEPTLLVSNKMDFAKQGGGINFVLVDGKLKYEINCKAIEKKGLKISSNVKGMGIVLE